MKKIFKFDLNITDEQIIYMPVGAKILCIQEQNYMPKIQAICDVPAANEIRTFRTYGTGNPLPEDIGLYIGTFQTSRFIWHVFEL